MKAWKTSSFIFSIILSLVIISWIYPTNNINIAGCTLKFANQKSISQRYGTKTNNYDPGLIASKNGVYSLKTKFQQIHEAIINYVPPKTPLEELEEKLIAQYDLISTPNNNVEWFNSIFQSLDSAQSNPIRIMHFGDSQIEEDHITGSFRELIQSKFGGFGVGLLPLYQTIPSTAIAQRIDSIPIRYLAYGPKSMRNEDSLYGPLALSSYIDGNYTVTFSRINLRYTSPKTKYWETAKVIIGHTEDTISVEINNQIKKTISTEFKVLKFEVGNTHYTKLKIKGKGLIYGICLDSKTGVQVDNIPMRGCSGTIFRRIASQSLKPYFDKFNVPLIILQYGGNTVPYIKSTESIKRYCHSIELQIKYIQECAPNTQLLFVGPSDMSTLSEGQRKSYSNIPSLIEGLRTTCLSNNVAFWSLYDAMGGKDSMLKWVDIGNAGNDYIHFTSKGSKKAGELLYKSLMSYYEYYKLQQYMNQKCVNDSTIKPLK